MQMDYVVKLNGKVFTILAQPANAHKKAVCPDGRDCYLDLNNKNILHRDDAGKIQAEPVIY